MSRDAMASVDTPSAKTEMRRWAKAARAALLAEERAAAAHTLVQSFDAMTCGMPEFDAPTFGGYRAMPGELDTGPLMGALAARGAGLALPRMVGRDKALQFHRWQLGQPLVRATWGIEEPLDTARKCLPDVLLVPLLAVDVRGNRLGYGAGYYDRTIEAVRILRGIWGMSRLMTIGLAFDALVVDAVPHSDYDQPLDWVLTPTRAFKVTR